jgi:DNA repair protein RadC
MSARHAFVLSASLLSDKQLVSMVLGGQSEAEIEQACRALSLFGDARTRALEDHRAGARVLAAIELGRRACLREIGSRGRVRGVGDAARALAPLLCSEDASFGVLVLDERMRLARAFSCARAAPGALLKRALACGGARVIVARRAAGAAVPTSLDVDEALALARAARAIECALVDWLVLGEDGAASLARLGLIEEGDVRWR